MGLFVNYSATNLLTVSSGRLQALRNPFPFSLKLRCFLILLTYAYNPLDKSFRSLKRLVYDLRGRGGKGEIARYVQKRDGFAVSVLLCQGVEVWQPNGKSVKG